MATITKQRARFLARNLEITTSDEMVGGVHYGTVVTVTVHHGSARALRLKSKSARHIRQMIGRDVGDDEPAERVRPGKRGGERLHAVIKEYAAGAKASHADWVSRRSVRVRQVPRE